MQKILLGKVDWTAELASDLFHQWLLDHAQFDYKSLKAGNLESMKANWRYFYTSNVSLKSEFIGDLRFSDQFKGWGFEDIEFGYRLGTQVHNKRTSTLVGMDLHYDEACRVLHDHPQKLDQVLANTRNGRQNALVFEGLHKDVKILPRGLRLFALKFILFFLALIPSKLLPKSLFWWREWKKSWIDKIK